MKVLNVGGGSRAIAIPEHYAGWDHVLLDVDPTVEPDFLGDAKYILNRYHVEGMFDAVYCAHNLEHYYPHEVVEVLQGFIRVLKDDGFAEIRVPDFLSVARLVVDANLDVDSVLYQSAMGPITVQDVLYGHGGEIAKGNVAYAHKTAFTPMRLRKVLVDAGFAVVYAYFTPSAFECKCLAFKRAPSHERREMLRI